jgi:hypothetical protein
VAGNVAIWLRTRELLSAFNQRRARQRPLSRFTPQAHRLFYQPGLCAVPRQQFRLGFGNIYKLTFKCFSDASVKRTARHAMAESEPEVEPGVAGKLINGGGDKNG